MITPTLQPEPGLSWVPTGNAVDMLHREWLVSNGLGGYASGTVFGANTRRYHGLLTPNLPTRGRTVLIAQLLDELDVNGTTAQLSGAEYENGTRDGDAATVLKEFKLAWREPTWIFNSNGLLLRKRIVMPFGTNTVVVQYTHLSGPECRLRLRPFLTLRGHDEPFNASPLSPLTIHAVQGQPNIILSRDGHSIQISVRGFPSRFVFDEMILADVHYRMEKHRGLDHRESLSSPGAYELKLTDGSVAAFVATCDPAQEFPDNTDQIFEEERSRLKSVLESAPIAVDSGISQQLVLAADQFLVLPGDRLEAEANGTGEGLRTIIAGYHWFTDWGRDTMISLEGLTLCTGRRKEARALLDTFSHYINGGLLPNHFPEGKTKAIYNTADATFWYFHAIDRYFHYTHDREILEQLFPKLRSVVDHHVRGTYFGIGMDSDDALMKEGLDDYALTWMDAKAGDLVVTPRRGKPVEIQALWFNSLKLMSAWAQELGETPHPWDELAARVKESFNKRFWYDEGRYLFDIVDGEKGNDAALRPNQIFSMSLRFPVLEAERWRPVFETVRKYLLTPYGLRTLAPEDRNYKSTYEGSRLDRDSAYHQGLVWPWLLGAYFDAWRRLEPGGVANNDLLIRLKDHLYEAGMGSVSEIFEAEPPFAPRGCIAQAWSVAEMIRILLLAKQDN